MSSPTLADVDPATIRGALERDGFAVVRRGTSVEPSELENVVARFGPLVFTPGEQPLPGTEYVFEVSNVGRTRPPRSVWHTDTSYVATPPTLTVLAAVHVPESGGDTLVLDQRRAAATAGSDLLEALRDVEFFHVASRVSRPDEAGAGAWHPALRSVDDGRSVALYVGARERLAGARRRGVAIAPAEASALMDASCEHATAGAPAQHRWECGDVLFIDNRSTLHAADHTDVVGDRVLHRVMCGSELPIAAPPGSNTRSR